MKNLLKFYYTLNIHTKVIAKLSNGFFIIYIKKHMHKTYPTNFDPCCSVETVIEKKIGIGLNHHHQCKISSELKSPVSRKTLTSTVLCILLLLDTFQKTNPTRSANQSSQPVNFLQYTMEISYLRSESTSNFKVDRLAGNFLNYADWLIHDPCRLTLLEIS